MKRWMAALIIAMMMLGLTSCARAPEATVPDDAYDLAYDMTEYDHFAEIFHTKSPDEWTALGAYTILLRGLHTPVLVDMNAMDVLAVHAFDQSAELGEAGAVFQDDCPVSIDSTEDAVVVNSSRDYDGETMILTEGHCYKFQPEGAVSTQVFVQEDGTFTYRRYWGEYETSFEQFDTAPLELCTSRDHFLYETGRAEIRDGEMVLTAVETVTVSNLYDLDTMFAEAKTQGLYEEYETVDDLLAAK